MRKRKLELAEQLAASIWAETRPPGLTGVVNGVQVINAATGQLANERRPDVLQGLLRHSYDMTCVLAEKVEDAPKEMAKSGGAANAARYALVEKYAVRLFEGGVWKSTRHAQREIWLAVQAEAKRLECELSALTGPDTLYRWLRDSKKA